jgi:hypothetical protein
MSGTIARVPFDVLRRGKVDAGGVHSGAIGLHMQVNFRPA